MQESRKISLAHFEKLMGPYGLYQHANKREPNLAEGYCVDDNARAIIVLLEYIRQFPTERKGAEQFIATCFTFIQDAHHAPGTYYNFRDAEGTWLTHDVSEDMYARLARMYAYVLSYDHDSYRKQIASELLTDLLPTLKSLTAPRAQAETIIALYSHPEFKIIAASHTQNLLALWHTESSKSWPWFENMMTYANALLPHGILLGSALIQEESADKCLYESTAFLVHSTVQDNIFTPIGNLGWYPRDGVAARYDQQAIEASTMFDFLLSYTKAFPEQISNATLLAPYHWFSGKNTKNIVLADAATGACLDGLNQDEPNQNYGAESMLAYLWAELLMNNTELKA